MGLAWLIHITIGQTTAGHYYIIGLVVFAADPSPGVSTQ